MVEIIISHISNRPQVCICLERLGARGPCPPEPWRATDTHIPSPFTLSPIWHNIAPSAICQGPLCDALPPPRRLQQRDTGAISYHLVPAPERPRTAW